MSKRLKTFVMVCIGFIVVGASFAGIGILFGANGNINFDNHSFNHGLWNAICNERRFGGEPESQAGFSGEAVTETIKLNQPIQSIDTKVGIGEIHLMEGKEFKVEFTYDKGFGKPNINFSDGKLSIADKFSKDGVNLEGKKWVSFKDDEEIEYRIYYPKGTKVEWINIDNSFGNIDISNIETNNLTIKVDAGEIKVEGANANNAELHSSFGDIKTKDLTTNGLLASTNMGDLHIEGMLKGSNKLSSDMGDIKIISALGKEEYSLNFDTQLGNIKVDDEETAGSYQSNSNTENGIDANASAGDIKAIFN